MSFPSIASGGALRKKTAFADKGRIYKMNAKAEKFQNYLNEKDITVFSAEDLHDERGTAVFRSHITVEGQQLPTIVITDNSVFVMVRVQVSPKALTEENKTAVLTLLNEQNDKYKPFKLYVNTGGDLLLDFCTVMENDELNGDTVYLMFDVVINYLNEKYRELMKTVW